MPLTKKTTLNSQNHPIALIIDKQQVDNKTKEKAKIFFQKKFADNKKSTNFALA